MFSNIVKYALYYVVKFCIVLVNFYTIFCRKNYCEGLVLQESNIYKWIVRKRAAHVSPTVAMMQSQIQVHARLNYLRLTESQDSEVP